MSTQSKADTYRKEPKPKARAHQPRFAVRLINKLKFQLVGFVLVTFVALLQSPNPDLFSQNAKWYDPLVFPLETNAVLRLPQTKGSLNDIFRLPGTDLVWVVGNDGFILHSKDAGRTWVQQSFKKDQVTEPEGYEQAPAQAVEESFETSILSRLLPISNAYAERDGGDDYFEPPSPPKPPTLVRGVVVEREVPDKSPEKDLLPDDDPVTDANSSTVSQQGQQSQQQQQEQSPNNGPQQQRNPNLNPSIGPGSGLNIDYSSYVLSELDLKAVHFIDKNVGVIIANNGVSIHTENGGKDWFGVYSTQTVFTDLTALSTGTFIATIDDGFVLHSNDNGKTWQNSQYDIDDIFTRAFALPGSATSGVLLGGAGSILPFAYEDNEFLFPEREIKNRFYPRDSKRWENADSRVSLANAAAFLGDWLYVSIGGEVWRGTRVEDQWQFEQVWWLRGITALASAGTTLFAADQQGVIHRIVDGVKAEPSALPFPVYINEIIASPDNVLLAVGDQGVLFRSHDMGLTWYSATRNESFQADLEANGVQSNHKYPAIWYWFVCLLFIPYFIWRVISFRKESDGITIEESIADSLVSDRPLSPGDPDPLNFGEIAAGLSRFMRNPSTEPPLSVAITGEWGSGKSSLMNLLNHDLRDNGFTPVWFNAWHHQKGEQLLASLYANIKEQAIPEWTKLSKGKPVGLLFRWNLLVMRAKRHALFSLLMLLLASSVITIGGMLWLSHVNGEHSGAILSFLKSVPTLGKEGMIALLFGGAAPPLIALYKSLIGFGLNPANLLTLGQAGSDKIKKIDPCARQRFAQEFNDVASCLELGHMVIFIDDLDRCSKENVVDILESINFLSVSGNCFLVLGMDEQWVKICIEQQFVEMAKKNPNFADDYLEKMINIKVPVPALKQDSSSKLLSYTPVNNEPTSFSYKETVEALIGRAAHYVFPTFVAIALALPLFVSINFKSEILEYIAKSHSKDETTITLRDNFFISDISVAKGKDDIRLTFEDAGSASGDHRNDARNNSRNQETATVGKSSESSSTEANDAYELLLTADRKVLSKGIKIGTLGNGDSGAALLLKQVASENTTSESIRAGGTEVGGSSLGGNRARVPGSSGNDGDTFNSGPSSFSSSNTDFITRPISSNPATYESGGVADSRWQVLIVLALISLLGALMPLARFLSGDRIVRDSPEFKEALRLWHPWIYSSRKTPRGLKRYLNRVRYIAMRARPEEGSGTDNQQIDDASLVALSAVFAFDENWVSDKSKFQDVFSDSLRDLIDAKYKASKGTSSLKNEDADQLFEQLKTIVKSSSMPNDENRKRFMDILATDESVQKDLVDK